MTLVTRRTRNWQVFFTVTCICAFPAVYVCSYYGDENHAWYGESLYDQSFSFSHWSLSWSRDVLFTSVDCVHSRKTNIKTNHRYFLRYFLRLRFFPLLKFARRSLYADCTATCTLSNHLWDMLSSILLTLIHTPGVCSDPKLFALVLSAVRHTGLFLSC